MEWIVLILFVAAGVQMYRLKKNPELKAKYDKENKETIESIKNVFKPSKKEENGISFEVNVTSMKDYENLPKIKDYVKSMNISLKLNTEKNILLKKLLDGEAIELQIDQDYNSKYSGGFTAIYKIIEDKVVGVHIRTFDDGFKLLTNIFEVKIKNDRFRTDDISYGVSDFTNKAAVSINAYYNNRTWEKALIENINIIVKD